MKRTFAYVQFSVNNYFRLLANRKFASVQIMESVSPTIKAMKSEMERLGWSVTDLAAKADIKFSTVYRIFNGDTAPRLDTLEAMATALKMKVSIK